MKQLIILLLVLTGFQAHSQPLEEMEYVLRYGIIKGGKAKLKATPDTYNGQKVIHYYMQAHTIGLPDKLYSVNDVYESFVDPVTFLPRAAIRNIKEQKYRYYNLVLFDQDADSIYSKRTGPMKVPNNLIDILGVFFYLRQHAMLDQISLEKEMELPVIHGHEIFNMQIKYLGSETIETKLGKVTCYVISPMVSTGKLLKRSDGLKFYITKDSKRLPIYMEFDMKFGALKCELESYKIKGTEQIAQE